MGRGGGVHEAACRRRVAHGGQVHRPRPEGAPRRHPGRRRLQASLSDLLTLMDASAGKA